MRTNAIEFSRHALHLVSIVERDAMGSSPLSHNMSYVATHTMFYLAAGSRRIHCMSEMSLC